MINSDSTKNWEHKSGAPVGYVSFPFLETLAKLVIKSQVLGRRKRKRKQTCSKFNFHCAGRYSTKQQDGSANRNQPIYIQLEAF